MEKGREALRENLERVKERMEKACLRSGRKPDDAALLAVTKTQPLEKVQALYSFGQRLFGENRLQEGREKLKSLPPDAQFHMIGHLQSNKTKEMAGFSCLQSLDRPKTALALEKHLSLIGADLPVLIEINTGGEENKDGVRDENELDLLLMALEGCRHLRVEGLMTMAPFTRDEKIVRASFQNLRGWQERLNWKAPAGNWSVLSMGMSNDFEWAIEEGSTLVRVGTLLFGERN